MKKIPPLGIGGATNDAAAPLRRQPQRQFGSAPESDSPGNDTVLPWLPTDRNRVRLRTCYCRRAVQDGNPLTLNVSSRVMQSLQIPRALGFDFSGVFARLATTTVVCALTGFLARVVTCCDSRENPHARCDGTSGMHFERLLHAWKFVASRYDAGRNECAFRIMNQRGLA